MPATRTRRPFFASSSHLLTLAHRGARAYAPENTMPAFKKAFELFNVDGVELDVHMTLDRELVVHHDDDLLRCTNIAERFLPGERTDFNISDYLLDEIRSLDAGCRFVGEFLKAPGGKPARKPTSTS